MGDHPETKAYKKRCRMTAGFLGGIATAKIRRPVSEVRAAFTVVCCRGATFTSPAIQAFK